MCVTGFELASGATLLSRDDCWLSNEVTEVVKESNEAFCVAQGRDYYSFCSPDLAVIKEDFLQHVFSITSIFVDVGHPVS